MSTTSLYWQAGIILAVSILAVIAVAAWTARHGVPFYRTAWEFLKTVPMRWKLWRNPELKRRKMTVALFASTLESLEKAKFLAKMAMDKPEFSRRAVDFLDANRQVAAAYFAKLTDDDLLVIAEDEHRDFFAGNVPVEDILAFLKSERQLIAEFPYLVTEHFARLAEAFQGRLPSLLDFD
jgi:hypothetical protein